MVSDVHGSAIAAGHARRRPQSPASRSPPRAGVPQIQKMPPRGDLPPRADVRSPRGYKMRSRCAEGDSGPRPESAGQLVLSARQRLEESLRRHQSPPQKRHNPILPNFKAKDLVVVIKHFASNSEDVTQLRQGQRATVEFVDRYGNLVLCFAGESGFAEHNAKQVVLKHNRCNLSLVKPTQRPRALSTSARSPHSARLRHAKAVDQCAIAERSPLVSQVPPTAPQQNCTTDLHLEGLGPSTLSETHSEQGHQKPAGNHSMNSTASLDDMALDAESSEDSTVEERLDDVNRQVTELVRSASELFAQTDPVTSAPSFGIATPTTPREAPQPEELETFRSRLLSVERNLEHLQQQLTPELQEFKRMMEGLIRDTQEHRLETRQIREQLAARTVTTTASSTRTASHATVPAVAVPSIRVDRPLSAQASAQSPAPMSLQSARYAPSSIVTSSSPVPTPRFFIAGASSGRRTPAPPLTARFGLAQVQSAPFVALSPRPPPAQSFALVLPAHAGP